MVMDKHQGQRMNYLQINIRTLRTKNKKKDIDREFVNDENEVFKYFGYFGFKVEINYEIVYS